MKSLAYLFRMARAAPEIVLGLVAALLALWIGANALSSHRARSNEQVCRANMRAIYQAIQLYREDNEGAYPPLLVEQTRTLLPQYRVAALAPGYLKDPSRLVCPADVEGGRKGWAYPCSYQYPLTWMGQGDPELARDVKRDLVDRFGGRLRLLTCPGVHPTAPPQAHFLTLHADGLVAWESIPREDPQIEVEIRLSRSFTSRALRRRASRPPTQQGAQRQEASH